MSVQCSFSPSSGNSEIFICGNHLPQVVSETANHRILTTQLGHVTQVIQSLLGNVIIRSEVQGQKAVVTKSLNGIASNILRISKGMAQDILFLVYPKVS